MTDNQNNFMSNIRSALAKTTADKHAETGFSQLFPRRDAAVIVERINSRTAREQQALIEVLRENAKSINLHTHVSNSLGEAAETVVDLIHTLTPEFSDVKHVILHNHPDIVKLDLDRRFCHEAVTIHTTFSGDPQVREKTIASFVGITSPFLGVADSATIIELSGPDFPRSTSLVPSVHIALLRREQVVADLTEASALLNRRELPNSFVFISGPSKTADIEAHMVHGAHGPREMHLILFTEPFVQAGRHATVTAEKTAIGQ